MSDWGKGVINNTIGWGQGAINNAIGWGSYYVNSWAGDTEIFGYDPSAILFFNAVENAGGELSTELRARVNRFVKLLKEEDLWDGVSRFYPLMGGNVGGARVELKTTTSATYANFQDVDVDSKMGMTPDGSTKSFSIDSPSEIWQNDQVFQMFGFLKGQSLGTAATNPIILGSYNTSTFAYYSIQRNSNATTWQGKAGGTGNLPNQTLVGSNESICVARFNSTTAYTIANGVESSIDTAANSSALSNIDFGLFTARFNSSLSNYSTQPINSFAFTEFATLEEAKNFNTICDAFIQDVIS